MNTLAEVGMFASRHPGFFAGIVSLLFALVSSWFRRFLVSSFLKVPSLFFRRTYLHRSLGDALIANMLKSGFKNKKFVGELYGEDPAFIKSEREVKHILYRDFSSNMQLFYKKLWSLNNWFFVSGMPLVYDKEKAKHYEYVVYSFRWSGNLIPLLEVATDSKNEKNDDEDDSPGFVVKRASGSRFFKEAKDANAAANGERIDRNLEGVLKDPFSSLVPTRWEKSNIGEMVYHNTIEMMSLNQELEDVLEEIQFWMGSQDWYEERGVPWKRGMLFYGKPGTGKTMFARALAEKLNVPLIIFDLASMTNADLIANWTQILPKRIVLFEDIDAIFDKRNNVLNNELSFDCLLNILDGADKKQGILTIVTTNHPEKLDPALGGPVDAKYKPGAGGSNMPTRPGRIDRSVEFLPLDKAGRLKLALRIVKEEKLAAKLVAEGENDSAAQLQERAFRAAIDLLFNKRKSPEAAKQTPGNGHNLPTPVNPKRA